MNTLKCGNQHFVTQVSYDEANVVKTGFVIATKRDTEGSPLGDWLLLVAASLHSDPKDAKWVAALKCTEIDPPADEYFEGLPIE